MTLEDCTKEELINFIRSRYFIAVEELEYSVLQHRRDKAFNQSQAERRTANATFKEYIDILKPYDGMPIAAVPDGIVSKSIDAIKRYGAHQKAAERNYKKYQQIEKQIDALFTQK